MALALAALAMKLTRHPGQAAFGGADPEAIKGRRALRWIPGQARNDGMVRSQGRDGPGGNAVPSWRQGQAAEFA
ncbi:hypothetical protein [uncultured Bosea sp.]|uniref:hypothetical protein n=1 Tax=uncultured Bosea sp. TaxID=211457 RepID=UPI00263BE00B|nr:hypothetical protein [uncultured Bosea sp.]